MSDWAYLLGMKVKDLPRDDALVHRLAVDLRQLQAQHRGLLDALATDDLERAKWIAEAASQRAQRIARRFRRTIWLAERGRLTPRRAAR